MKRNENTLLVEGTAALQPNCSRYRNENERIIVFPEQEQVPEFYRVDFASLASAQLAPVSQRMLARIQHGVQKSTTLYDLRTGNLEGKPLFNVPWYKMASAGFLYTCIGLAVLYFSV